ncbi:MAG: transposase [Bacteroidota bacterium]
MHHKNIKAIIKIQLKTYYPNWKRLPKKMKRSIAKKVRDEVVNNYDFKKEIKTSKHELLGLEGQLLTPGIMNLDQMARFIDSHENDVLFKLNSLSRHPLHIKDEELKFVDNLLDDRIINKLLSYDGYTPSMRDFFPSSFLRAELLKVIKYPEISYRKFCGDDKTYKGYKENSDYIGMENKQNRAFIGLPLNKKQMISHVQMSQFRSSLSFKQLVNLTVYILHHFKQSGYLDDNIVHCVDSTELPVDCQELLATLTIGKTKIRIYDDIDCDCGKRRTKRDKSIYVVGYRLHTLTAINAKTGQSFPLISLLAPANHHDSHFLEYLVRFGKAIGLELKLITADEAYHDNDDVLYSENGVHLIKPPNSKVSLPENVDSNTFQVHLDDLCEIPMDYAGIGEKGHEFKCSAGFGQCPRASICLKYRHIPIDNGRFQRILYGGELVSKALDIRKNGERPFNLLKKREGLEPVRVRSQQGLVARVSFATIATLLLEMVGTRRKKKEKYEQMDLLEAVGY